MSAAPSDRRPRPHRPPAPGSAARGPRTRPDAIALHAAPGLTPGLDRLLWRLTLLVVALLGITILIMVLGPHRVGDYMTETDFYGQYAAGARLIQHGRLEPARYGVVGPGYELALAVAGLVVRNLFLAAGLLSLASSSLALLLWAALLRRRADARVALGAALFMATNATLFRYGYSVTTDAFALALQAATFYVLLARPGLRAATGAGVLAALAFLTRYNAGVLLPAGLVAIAAGGALQEQRGRAALLFVAGFVLPVLPWVIYSFAHGTGVTFQLHHNIAYEVFARAKGIPWDTYQRTLQPQFHSLADVIARDPGAVAGRMLFNIHDHLRLDATRLLGWPLALCAVLGLGVGLADGALRRLWPLAPAGALLFLALVPAFHSERYSLALLPYYATAAALFFASPRFALVLLRGPRIWLKPALALLPLAFALAATVRSQARVIDQLPVEVLDAARTLRSLAHPGDRVIARKAHIAFHSGIEPVPFPFVSTLPELAAYARTQDARWLYFSWPEGQTRPEFWYLLDTTAVVPGLTPRCVTAPHPAVLYEIGPAFGRAPAWAANDTLRAWYSARGQLAVDPSDPQALRSLGTIELTRGRLAEARVAYEHAARRLPRDAALQLALGKVCIRLGDLAAGATAFERAETLDPTSVDARIGRGWALLFAGRQQEAAAVWRPVVALTRDSDTLRGMIELFQTIGRAQPSRSWRAGGEPGLPLLRRPRAGDRPRPARARRVREERQEARPHHRPARHPGGLCHGGVVAHGRDRWHTRGRCRSVAARRHRRPGDTHDLRPLPGRAALHALGQLVPLRALQPAARFAVGAQYRSVGCRRPPPSTAGCSPSSVPICMPGCALPSSAPAPAPGRTRNSCRTSRLAGSCSSSSPRTQARPARSPR
jgi:tetratricopeptide (TPR) repeat protein